MRVFLAGASRAIGRQLVPSTFQDPRQISAKAADNARVRTEGTRNLIAAAQAAKALRFLARSIAWRLPGDAHDPVEKHERMVLDAGGVVARYGRFRVTRPND